MKHLDEFNPLIRFYDLTPELIGDLLCFLRSFAQVTLTIRKGEIDDFAAIL